MTFNHNLLEVPYSLEQINTEDYRYYVEEGVENQIKMPSITTVLGAVDTKDWSHIPRQVMERAAARGTYMHDLCEKYVLNELELPVPKSVDVAIAERFNTGRALFYQIKPFLDKGIDTVYMSESKLKSDKLRIAGTVDLFAKIAGKNIVLDYKSSGDRKDRDAITGYFAQGTFYSAAIEESFGINVDGVMILISTEREGVQTFYLNRNKGEHLQYQKYLVNARKEFFKQRGF